LADDRPNILFIMSDDHASHAMSCYGSRINETPNLDRIASGGMRFDNCFCTNSICAPSRATILTGTYNHINGVTTLGAKIDGRQENFAKLLQGAGYQTALVGKWHLGHGGHHDPTGFDHWDVLPGQGDYHNPEMNRMGDSRRIDGYVTDIITDLSLEWLEARDKDRPFCLMLHHKAPHRWWEPDEKHAEMYEDVDIPEPETLWDDYENRASAAREAKMRVDRDLSERDLKGPTPDGLSPEEEKRWKYQRYIKDYLRCVASVDDNVGRVIDYLDVDGAAKNTLICYTSDQGFFLGDHGWYDKRFMYEESLRMPFIVRYPEGIQPGSVNQRMVLNVDFPATFLDYAGVEVPGHFQGRSLRSLLEGATSDDWRTSMYYRYWMHLSQHHVYAHYGIRTHDYKLIYYYADALGQPGTVDDTKPPEWELFDLQKDPSELNNVFNDPAYAEIVPALRTELRDLQLAVDDEPYFKEDDL
jgi:arylsulfatase A-like enzyme